VKNWYHKSAERIEIPTGRTSKSRGEDGEYISLEVEYDTTEKFTHRIDLADRTLWGDPANQFYGVQLAGKHYLQSSGYGREPDGWDAAKAIPEAKTFGPHLTWNDVS